MEVIFCSSKMSFCKTAVFIWAQWLRLRCTRGCVTCTKWTNWASLGVQRLFTCRLLFMIVALNLINGHPPPLISLIRLSSLRKHEKGFSWSLFGLRWCYQLWRSFCTAGLLWKQVRNLSASWTDMSIWKKIIFKRIIRLTSYRSTPAVLNKTVWLM